LLTHHPGSILVSPEGQFRVSLDTAKEMARRHTAVITWARDANPAIGEYGPSEVLFQADEVPDLD